MMLDDLTPKQLAEAEKKYAAVQAAVDRLTMVFPLDEPDDLRWVYARASGPIQKEVLALSVTFRDAANFSMLIAAELLRRMS